MRACLEVDLKPLKHNVRLLSSLNQKEQGFFCPIIKANAYGHGALEVGQALPLAGVKQVGVVSVDEALELKGLTGVLDIYILGPLYKEQIPWLKLYGFIPIVGDWEDLKALAVLGGIGNKPIPFHLKFNTGMNRFGFQPSEKEKILEYIQKNPGIKLTGLASHLSEGELAGSLKEGSAFQQIQQFKKVCDFWARSLPQTRLNVHLLNSAGWLALYCHRLHKTLSLGFRPGIALYGIKPPIKFLSSQAKERYQALPLKPVACLKSFVVRSFSLPTGKRVSYGGEWKSQKKSVLAVVSMGYADGLPYNLSGEGKVLFRGERVPIAGRICMDFFMIDVSQQARKGEIQTGEEVVIFGRQKQSFISVEEQAKNINSIPHEFLTRVSSKALKIYKGL